MYIVHVYVCMYRALEPCWYSFSVILQAACYSRRKQKLYVYSWLLVGKQS